MWSSAPVATRSCPPPTHLPTSDALLVHVSDLYDRSSDALGTSPRHGTNGGEWTESHAVTLSDMVTPWTGSSTYGQRTPVYNWCHETTPLEDTPDPPCRRTRGERTGRPAGRGGRRKKEKTRSGRIQDSKGP